MEVTRMQSFPLEWAEVSPGVVVVATEQRGWVYQPGDSDAFSEAMRTPGTPASTGRLLETAREAGRAAARRAPESAQVQPPRFSTDFWAWYLCGNYVTTRHTPPVLREAAIRLTRAGRGLAAGWAARRSREEEHHDELALRDLRALGLDAERVVQNVVHPSSEAQAALFSRYVHTEDPVECIGFAFAVERVSGDIGEEFVQYVEARLPPGVNATRCLRVHSTVGADDWHLSETIQLVSELTAEERIRIARACFETARAVYSQEPPPDEPTLQRLFSPFRLAPAA
jgi:hypothetical protein